MRATLRRSVENSERLVPSRSATYAVSRGTLCQIVFNNLTGASGFAVESPSLLNRNCFPGQIVSFGRGRFELLFKGNWLRNPRPRRVLRLPAQLQPRTVLADNPFTDTPNSARSASSKSLVDSPFRYSHGSTQPASPSSGTAATTPSENISPSSSGPASSVPAPSPARPPSIPPAQDGSRCVPPLVAPTRPVHQTVPYTRSERSSASRW